MHIFMWCMNFRWTKVLNWEISHIIKLERWVINAISFIQRQIRNPNIYSNICILWTMKTNKISSFRMHSCKQGRLHWTFDKPLKYLFHSIPFTCKRHLSPAGQQARQKTWKINEKGLIPTWKNEFSCSFCRIDCSFRQFFIIRSKNAVSPDFFRSILFFLFRQPSQHDF